MSEPDPLDDLFVCPNCGSSLSKKMPRIMTAKKNFKVVKECLEEALERLKEIYI